MCSYFLYTPPLQSVKYSYIPTDYANHQGLMPSFFHPCFSKYNDKYNLTFFKLFDNSLKILEKTFCKALFLTKLLHLHTSNMTTETITTCVWLVAKNKRGDKFPLMGSFEKLLKPNIYIYLIGQLQSF